MTTEPTAADLIDLVVAIPGVRGIEPGVGTTLRALDARIRRNGKATRFGLHIDHTEGTVTVEVCLDRTRPVRESVREIQTVLQDALRDSVSAGAAPARRPAASGPATSGVVPTGPAASGPEIHVRVQSLDMG